MDRMLLDIPTSFESDRLLLRCYRAGDGPVFHAMIQANKDHLRGELKPAELTVDQEGAEIRARKMAAHWVARERFVLGVWEKSTAAYVGEVFIEPVNWEVPEFEIGYFVVKEREGQGIVTEAVKASLRFVFETVEAHKVRITCKDTNTRSARVAERCGFVKEGHLREMRKLPDGRFVGILHYGLLRSEYEGNQT